MKIMNNLLILMMLLINIISIILNLTINYEVNILVCISLSIVIIMPKILKKKMNISDITELIFLGFILLAGELGSVFKFYDLIGWYDSFTHLLSGTVTGYVALLILKKNKNYKNKFMNILFVMSLVLSIAACWEIFEFSADNLLGNDAQRVLATGVTDTMKDIICAFLGGILFLVSCLYNKEMDV